MSLSWLLKSFSEEDEKPVKAPKPKDELNLAGILQRQRLRLHKQEGPRKASNYFNPSAFSYGFCMREKVAQLAGYHEIWIKHPTPKEQLTFDAGNAYHEIIQGYFWKAGMLEGRFKCQACRAEGYGRSPTNCYACDSSHLEYREVPFLDKEYQIRGRADGILWVEVTKNVEERQVFDIKSIRNKDATDMNQFGGHRRSFEDLDELGPPVSHLIQLMLYMRQLDIHGGHLLYVAKNSHQLKSFYIKYNEELLAPYLEMVRKALDWANELKEGKRTDLPPPCDKAKCLCEQITRPGVGSENS